MSSAVRQWRRYPRCTGSSVVGLGDLPEHWELIRVKALEGNAASSVRTGPFGAQLHSHDYVDEGVPLVLIRNVADMRIDDSDVPRVSESDAERLSEYRLREGDIVFSRVGSIGRTALCSGRENGWLISGQMLRLRIQNPRVDPRFLAYACSCTAVLSYVELQSVGSTRESINTEILRNLPLPIPTSGEQRTIATFLDRQTARIDALIAKKQRQIELLQEKRTAIITCAVTKGLNPDVRMKDSGVEWLGEIPEHWQVVRLKAVLSAPLQYGANEPAEYEEPSWPRYIRITDIDPNGALRPDTFKSLPETVAAPYLLEPGDLLFARSGATVGKTILYDKSWGRAAFAGYLLRTRFRPDRTTAGYVAQFCSSHCYWSWLRSSFIQSTIENVSAERYTNMMLPLPPVPEQVEIVGALAIRLRRLGAVIEKISESMVKLQEYRTALISAAVTGKIDVRGEVS